MMKQRKISVTLIPTKTVVKRSNSYKLRLLLEFFTSGGSSAGLISPDVVTLYEFVVDSLKVALVAHHLNTDSDIYPVVRLSTVDHVTFITTYIANHVIIWLPKLVFYGGFGVLFGNSATFMTRMY